MLSGPNAELIKQLWQQQSGYEKPKLRSMVWRSYRGIQAEIHRQILPAEVWSAVLVCRKSRLLFMCGPWTRCSTWCNSQECEHHVYQHQSDAGNMRNNCQTPAQLNTTSTAGGFYMKTTQPPRNSTPDMEREKAA